MINKKMITLIVMCITTFSISGYYDAYGNRHPGVVASTVEKAKEAGTEILDTVTGGRYSDTPEDRKDRIKAERKLEDKKIASKRKYEDTQEKIQRKKENRKYRYTK